MFFSLDFGLAILNGLTQLEIVRLIAVGSKMNSMLKEMQADPQDDADVRKAFLGRSESLPPRGCRRIVALQIESPLRGNLQSQICWRNHPAARSIQYIRAME